LACKFFSQVNSAVTKTILMFGGALFQQAVKRKYSFETHTIVLQRFKLILYVALLLLPIIPIKNQLNHN